MYSILKAFYNFNFLFQIGVPIDGGFMLIQESKMTNSQEFTSPLILGLHLARFVFLIIWNSSSNAKVIIQLLSATFFADKMFINLFSIVSRESSIVQALSFSSHRFGL
jgi:hypothetical protein